MMKLNKQIILAIAIMIATSALYRVLPGRPYGFAPQIAIALFGGSLFASRKQYAFLLPILSMFISDVLYQVLFYYHLSPMQGFYVTKSRLPSSRSRLPRTCSRPAGPGSRFSELRQSAMN